MMATRLSVACPADGAWLPPVADPVGWVEAVVPTAAGSLTPSATASLCTADWAAPNKPPPPDPIGILASAR